MDIKIDDITYTTENASDAAKVQLMHIQAIDVELSRMSVLTAILQTARANYVRVLKQELDDPGSTQNESVK